MSKRKPIAGGYCDSSDGPEEEPLQPPPTGDNPAKKAKSLPYAPPRLFTTPLAAKAPFQLPRSVSTHIRRTATPTPPVHPDSPQATPTPHNQSPLVENAPHLGSEAQQLQASNIAADGVALAHVSAPHTSNRDLAPNANKPTARSTLSLERRMNELSAVLEGHMTANDEQTKRTDEKLNRLLEAVGRLVSREDGHLDPAPSRHASVSPSPITIEAQTYLSNPSPTPELASIVARVVNEARHRIGTKKGGADDNSLKEHARITFYRMLAIKSAKAIHPYFEDEHGEPDTLPLQFVDPDTGYCQPYPHWRASLTKQVAWIPTYMLRFKATVPKNRGELSNLLSGLSDEQIVVLLHDGPFRSAQAAWRDMKKTNVELDEMRMEARRYRRTDKKATLRSSYIKSIPALQSPEWEYLTQPGYVSQDESDEEGELVTKRPKYRAQWEINLYDAMSIAELEKPRTRPGPDPRPPPPRVEYVSRPVPHLERGSGSNKVTIRVALSGLSKSWREANPDGLKKYGHLLNLKASTKPDISAFLAKYPTPVKPEGNESDPDGNHSNAVVNSKESRRAVSVGSEGQGAGDTYSDHEDGEYSQIEEAASAADRMPEDYNQRVLAGGYGGLGLSGAPVITNNEDFPIDPSLLDDGVGNQKYPEDHVRPGLGTGSADTTRTQSMPPPPPMLQLEADSVQASHRKGANSLSGTKQAGEPPLVKKRGRPPGSKNKNGRQKV